MDTELGHQDHPLGKSCFLQLSASAAMASAAEPPPPAGVTSWLMETGYKHRYKGPPILAPYGVAPTHHLTSRAEAARPALPLDSCLCLALLLPRPSHRCWSKGCIRISSLHSKLCLRVCSPQNPIYNGSVLEARDTVVNKIKTPVLGTYIWFTGNRK